MSSEIEVTVIPENAEKTEKFWCDDEIESIRSCDLIVTQPAQLINRLSSHVDLYMRTSDKQIKHVYNLIKWSKICGCKHC